MTISPNIGPDYRPIGSDGTVLMAEAAQADGVKWKQLTNSDISQDFSITSFNAVTGTLWTGTVLLNPTFNATYQTTPSGARITYNATPYEQASPFTFMVVSGSVSGVTPNTYFTYLLAAEGVNGSGMSTATIAWKQKQFWGSAIASGNSQAFIDSLSDSEFADLPSGSHTITMATGQYGWFAFSASAGTPDFYDDNGLIGGWSTIAVVSYINTAGYSEFYRLFRTENHTLGTLNFIVR